MNPIIKFLRNLTASNRIIGDSVPLKGLAKADALLSILVNDKKVPGIAITVIKAGDILLQKGYGYADIASQKLIDPKRTVFRIASISKNIAAATLAHLIDEEVINLDASFYDYVPYYPKKEYDFTIRQLASHTAGIRSYRGAEYGLNKPFSIKQGIAIFKNDPLVFEPGTQYLYNSFDWTLLSLAMQEASGVPFADLVQKKVFDPLGMVNTFAGKSPDEQSSEFSKSEIANLSTFYSKNRNGFRKAIPVDNYYKLAGGGFLSTSEDISNFGLSILKDEVFTATMKAEFLTSLEVNEEKTFYGLGWQVSEDKQGRPFYGHVGNGVGGYSNFFVYPNEKVVFSILINCTDPKVQEDLDEVISLFIDNDD
ncbi:serine hydrolase domain-containing protein [Aurantibacter sp.]|uniref:serine hydrolase domain-containing protein n=1 Tax=Aurantibacter sp. TaxID=2807103 RepID=UPI00326309D3